MDETQRFHEAASQGCWNHMALHILFCLPGRNHWEEIIAAAPSPGLGSQLSMALVLPRAQERQSKAENQPCSLPLDHTNDPPDFVLMQCWRPLCPHQLLWDQDPFPSSFSTAPPHSLSSSGSSVLSASLGLSPHLITATKLL